MYYYKATIKYEGTNYAGFQWQNGIQTIQSEFNTAISKLIAGKITTSAASRTDTGVHALEQIVKICSGHPIDCSSFLLPFNLDLPREIRCVDISECSGNFRPSTATSSKEYRYFFTNKTQVPKEETQFIANISNPLNFDAMKVCLHELEGHHDFCNFYSSGSNVKSTVRDIHLCDLTEVDPHTILSESDLFQIPKNLHSCYQLQIKANGFLKQMIRHIVSALWMVGSGKLTPEEFIQLLNGPKSKKQLWKVASPNGLFLYKINLKTS